MNRTERTRARDIVTHAALLSIQHKDEIHYTQDWQQRWSGINNKLVAAKGQFPRYGDCSAFVTWWLWQVLGDGPDVVNGQNWTAGYTGTMAQHGMVIEDHQKAVRGDAILYGSPGGSPFHTAMVIGRHDGQLVVASHGEESGPYIVPWNTWQVHSIRRYITAETNDFVPQPKSKPEPVSKPKPGQKIWQGEPVPALIRKGSGQYLGLIGGPAASHGGATENERRIVKMLQQRLIACGFVPGESGVHSDWADGLFQQETKRAVTRFQERHMAGTQYYGQVWNDDWQKLFNL